MPSQRISAIEAQYAKMTEQAKQTYFCKTCKATLFSYSDMAAHVGATGHEEYDVRANWPEK